MPLTDLLDRVPFAGKHSLPGFDGATGWLNSEPLTPAELRGRVVLADFWTYTCINWIRTLPYLRRWMEVYGPHGLVIVGVHTPEFSIEHRADNVRRAVQNWGIHYPIALDNDYAIWNAFVNQYWPALYLADKAGQIRHQLFGERGYERLERAIRRLLVDGGRDDLPESLQSDGRGIEAAADWSSMRSPETYVGWGRSTGFASPGGTVHERSRHYELPSSLFLNEWALTGDWTVQREAAVLSGPQGSVTYRFHARDLNLVLSPPTHGSTARIRVRLDGEPPGDSHGLDVNGDGGGVLAEPRLYQLIRQRGPVQTRVCEIEICGSGAAAFCFTFG